MRWRSFDRAATVLVLGLAPMLLAGGEARAQVAAPSSQLIAGGDNVSSQVYRDLLNCYSNQGAPVFPGDFSTNLTSQTCTLIPAYNATVAIFYVGVGTPNGKAALLNYNNSDFTGVGGTGCPVKATSPSRVPDPVPVNGISNGVGGGPESFWGTGTAATWVPSALGPYPVNAAGACNVSFIGSALPLTDATAPGNDMSVYGGLSGTEHAGVDFHALYGQTIQLPLAIAAVAVPYSPATGTWTEHGKFVLGNTSLLDLNVADLCDIMNGTIKSWNASALAHTLTAGAVPIRVVIRKDSSSTTFTFANALIAQCTAAGHALSAAYFAPTTPANAPGQANTSFWENAKAAMIANGVTVVDVVADSGVQASINANPGSIGYLPNSLVHLGGTAYDPLGPSAANLQTAASIGHTAAYKAPTTANAVHILDGFLPPAAKTGVACAISTHYAQNTSPDGVCAHNPVNWSALAPKPSSTLAYGIGGFVYADMFTCYKQAADFDNLFARATSGVKAGFFEWWFSNGKSRVKATLARNGFAPVPAIWVTGNATQDGILGNGTGNGLIKDDVVTAPAVAHGAGTACATIIPGA